MPQVGFEPKTPVFERAKAVHASDLAHFDRRYSESIHVIKEEYTVFAFA
jgi:hypothetical protein